MRNAESFIQAYSLAPWRRQRQYIFTFLLVLVGITAVAGIYLYVTGQAAITGREVQVLQLTIKSMEQDNANMEAEIAYLMSAEVMTQRSQSFNAQPFQIDQVVYLAVPGLTPKQPIKLAVAASPTIKNGPILTPEYSLSLLDWVDARLDELQPIYYLAGGGKP